MSIKKLNLNATADNEIEKLVPLADQPTEKIVEDLVYDNQFSAAELMLWLDDSKRDHLEDYKSDITSPCETAEVLLARGLNVKTLTPEEEYDLFKAYLQETDPKKKAMLRNEFLTRNLRLVMHLAKQQAQRCEYEPKDLIAWGTLGMIRAFEKFELERGAKFSTYAAKWIQQGMTRGLAETQRSIRIPYNIITDQGKMKKFQQDFLARTGVEATDEDICDYFDWSEEKLAYIRKGLTPISSIDVPATEGEDSVCDLIEDEGATSVEDLACGNVNRELLLKTLHESLDDRARDVIMNLYDFFGRDSLDKDELAEKYGVTRERILQIRDESISILRHPSKSRKLRGLVG